MVIQSKNLLHMQCSGLFYLNHGSKPAGCGLQSMISNHSILGMVLVDI